jgi:hypothetical protein
LLIASSNVLNWVILALATNFQALQEILSTKKTRKSSKMEPRRWLQGFMERNPTVSFGTPSNLSRASANVSAAEIVGFIDGKKKYLERKNLLHLLDDPTA